MIQPHTNDYDSIVLPGQYYDQETNLHYNYFRDYDPSIGRYVESDSIGLMGGLNTYSYVNANPLMYVDKFGLLLGIPGLPKIVGEAGLQASALLFIAGISVSVTAAVSTGGEVCRLITVCLRFGPGFYLGAGGVIGGGLVSQNTSGLGGPSIRLSGDVGAGPAVGGSVGVSPGSVSTARGHGGVGWGIGGSLDLCNTFEECVDAKCVF